MSAAIGQPEDICFRLEVAALRASLPSVPPAERAPTRRYGDAEYALGRYNLETSTVHEGLFLLTEFAGGGGGGDGGQSPTTLQQTGLLSGSGGGTPPRPTLMYGVVPAGVATVTQKFPATHPAGQSLPALSARAKVVNDVFVIPVPTLFERGGWPNSEVWRSASGQVIKTVDERPFHP